jgi:hypothetical protein
VVNFSLQYAAYLSLNFGDKLWYRHGPYINVLYHLSPAWQVDLSVGKQFIYWSTSEEFDAIWPGDDYKEPVYRPWTVDVGVTYRLRR